jgi:predicted RNA binding protein YcfA (HicA-like mRNA interferase family)
MPALDLCHPQIVRALEKAGWQVTHNPLTLAYNPHRTVFADLELQHQDEDGQRTIIVVEVKCFPPHHPQTEELYVAIGQYIVYRSILREAGITTPVYLAVPGHAYEGIFTELALPIIREIQLKMIVVNLSSEVIEQWIE